MRCLSLGPPVLSGPRSGSGGFSFQNEGAFTNIFHLLGVLVLEGLKDAITYIPCGGPRTGAQAARLSPDGCSPVSASPPSLISSCWNSEKVKEAKQAYFLNSTGFCPQQPPRACSISVPVAAVVLFDSGPLAPTVKQAPHSAQTVNTSPPLPSGADFLGTLPAASGVCSVHVPLLACPSGVWAPQICLQRGFPKSRFGTNKA